MKWSGEYRVGFNDVDCNDIVSASNVLRYMQDASSDSMEEKDYGPSYRELYDAGFSYILSRVRMSLYTPLHIHDRLEVQSWAVESAGYQFNRCCRILRDGVIMAEAAFVWALVGIEDRRPHRVSEFDLHYRTDSMLELDVPERFRIPEDVSMHLTGERSVEYADIDRNGHLTNTRYPDLLCSYLNGGMKGERVISMGISFLTEAPLGSALKFYSGQSDGVWYARTLLENGKTNVEAEILTEPV